MFKTFINAFKIKDIRKKLLYTLLMLVVIRIGSQIPTPGMNVSTIKGILEGFDLGVMGMFTGGAFEQASIMALNITPYITSSIIIQLMTIAIPKLEEMQNDGEDGRKKIQSLTRYITVGLALLESAAMAFGFRGALVDSNSFVLNFIMVMAAMTAGSAFLMWVGGLRFVFGLIWT